MAFQNLSLKLARYSDAICTPLLGHKFSKLRHFAMLEPNDSQEEGDPQPTHKRGQLSNESRAAIVQALLEHSKDRVLKRGVIKAVATRFDVNRAAIRRVWKRALSSVKGPNGAMVSLNRKSSSGRKKKGIGAENCHNIHNSTKPARNHPYDFSSIWNSYKNIA